jgi:hypothetical protein
LWRTWSGCCADAAFSTEAITMAKTAHNIKRARRFKERAGTPIEPHSHTDKHLHQVIENM